jgi:hypothetical protein
MFWEKPHISKIYEALTAIADERIELIDKNHAKCYSSSKGKYYEIEFDPKTNSISSNDNTAFYTGSISYPMIAYFMLIGKISYDKDLISIMKGIHWKDINQKFKNNYDKAIESILNQLSEDGHDVEKVESAIQEIYEDVSRLQLIGPDIKKQPPVGY